MCELSPVTFHGDTIFCIDYQNQPFTPMKPIVQNMGLDWASQSVKLNANKERWGVVMIATPSDGGEQKMLSMPVRKLPAWLNSINPKKVRPELRAKIELYQAESDDALWNYWMNGRAERPTPAPAPDATISPAERAELKALVDAKLSAAPAAVQGKARAEIWTRFNRHFRIAEYAQLPASKMPDARDYLIQLSVKALQPAPQPVEPAPCTQQVAMPTGRADALRKIESAITAISGAQDVLRLFCHPGAVTMRMAAHERALYHAEHTLFTHAIDTLYFVQCALENGNTLERLRRTPDAGRGLSAARG